MSSENKKSGKLKWIIIVIVALVIIGAIGSNSGGKDDKKDNPTSKEKFSDDSTSESTPEKIQITDFLTCPEFTAEKNTTAMVDQIATTAKDNAENLTEEEASEIINIIRETGHQFYDGSDEMELFMWYGYLLDYKYEDSDPRSELGTDLYQAIKYVYRNVETVTDDATQSNLSQIDKSLALIQ